MVSASRRVVHKMLARVFEEGAYADRAWAAEALSWMYGTSGFFIARIRP